MKKKRVQELPPCDFANLSPVAETCSLYAKYDAPTKSGSWAFMCEAHYKMHAAKGADALGCEFVVGIAKPKDSSILRGIEPGLEDLEYWEEVLMNSERFIKCPNCSELKCLEPDAEGIYHCEGCGMRVQCPTPPM